jgi:RDD family
MKTKAIAHLREARFVTPEALNVAQPLVGQALAQPTRRALAMGLDLLVVALLSGVSGFWLLGGLAAVVLQLRNRGAAITRKRQWVGWALAGLLGLLAINEAKDQWLHRNHPAATARAAKAAAKEAADDAAAEMRQAAADATREAQDASRVVTDASDASDAADAEAARKVAAAAQAAAQAMEAVASKLGGKVTGGPVVRTNPAEDAATAPLSAASAAEAAALASAEAARVARVARVARNRISDLEAQLAEAKKPKPFSPRAEMKRLIAGIGLQFGWGMVYFSLLPAWWGGQTVGKKVFGLRVVEITGKPMTVMRCLKRYGGYAAGMATGGLGFGQVLWDANRQGIQDKAAHTVVLDVRSAQAAKPATPESVPVETPPPSDTSAA